MDPNWIYESESDLEDIINEVLGEQSYYEYDDASEGTIDYDYE